MRWSKAQTGLLLAALVVVAHFAVPSDPPDVLPRVRLVSSAVMHHHHGEHEEHTPKHSPDAVFTLSLLVALLLLAHSIELEPALLPVIRAHSPALGRGPPR